MTEFEVLKKSWHNQKLAENIKINNDKITGEYLSGLKKFEKKQFKINLAKTTGIVLVFAYLFWSMLIITPFSLIKGIAVVWIAVSLIVFLIVYWKIQLKVNNLNVRGNSLNFIDEVLENFSRQKKLFKEKFWIFGASLIAGVNILYLDLLKSEQFLKRLEFHVLFTVIMIAVIWGGIKIRMLRFKKEYEPIENELTKIKNDLSE